MTDKNLFAVAMVFEGGLAIVAMGIGWLANQWPLPGLPPEGLPLSDGMRAVGWGLLGTLPMLAGLAAVEGIPLRIFRELDAIVDRLIVPLFRRCSLLQMGLISLLAGVGEEMLFRGLLQDGLAAWIGSSRGPWIGLIVASLAFGLAHSLTAGYALVATLIGVYLGGLLLWTDNILCPITAHACYDFCALIYLTRTRQRASSPDPW
jgi:membrane protease YdiL (CAAX protease family)